MTPQRGQRVGLRTSTGSRTSRTGRGRRGEDGGARRGREARRVEDVAETRGEGGGAAGRGEVRGVMAALIVEDRGVVGLCSILNGGVCWQNIRFEP